jgi:predicted enzyme related to lactoylglutathione lyase
MAQPRTYPQGVTSWIDTEQPDLEAARVFYAGLFGWTLTDAIPANAPESYLIATLDGDDVAALASAPAGAAATWNTYVAVDNADATVAAVLAGGGSVIAPPEDAGQAGRAATCADPFGAVFRLWQAGNRLGAQRANAPGSWNFSDLYTPDREAAMAFYTPVFGWRAADLEGAGTMLQVPGYGDHLAATVDPGIHERQGSAPEGFADAIGGLLVIPAGQIPRWHVTFTVADRDESAATAQRLGATIVTSSDNLWTKDALVRDPQGAEFTVSQFTPPDGDW